jgi:PAS domain S-box-containing protein
MSKVNEQMEKSDFSDMQHLKDELERLQEQVDQLTLQNTRSQYLISQITDAVLIVNKSGIITDASIDYGTLTDLRKEQITGVPIWDVFKRIRLEDSLYKHPMAIADLPVLHMAARDEEKSVQTIIRKDGDVMHTQAAYFIIDEGDESFIGISIKDITEEYLQKHHLERNRVRMRMMVKQRTEEYNTLNETLVTLNEELSAQIEEKIKAQDELAKVVRAQAMADSETRFGHIINRLQDMVMTVDEQGIIRYVTPSCQTTYGHSENELIGQSAYSIVHPNDISKVKAHINSVMQSDEPIDCNYRIRRKNDEWAEVKSVMVNMLNDPQINGCVITYTDITKQAKAQRQIEYSLAKQQLINNILVSMQKSGDIAASIDDALEKAGQFTDVGKVFVFEKSDDGKYMDMAYEWCNTGLIPRKNTLQQIPIELFHPWNADFSDNFIIRYPGSKHVNSYIFETLLVDGMKSMIMLPLFVNGAWCGYLGFAEYREVCEWTQEEESLLVNFAQILSSVLQRQKSEKAQQLLQQSLSMVLDNIPMHIHVIDKENHEILFANRAVRDAADNSIMDIKGAKDIENHAFEYYDRQTDKWTYRISTPITWIDGRLVYLRTIEDVTERKKMELELLNAKNHAEESDKLKSAFLANVSHEIRTPMNAIIGFSQILFNEVNTDELRQYISIINENCLLLLKLIDDIIDISKMESGQLKINPVPCSLNKFLDAIKKAYDKQLVQRPQKDKIELLIDEIPPETMIITDSIRLRQIVGNLLDNAIKFTDKGYIKVNCNIPGDGLVHFSVADSGIGIPENQHQVIFEHFRQSQNLRNLSGTGLGLAISKGLARMLGGDMWLRSTVGEGSTFYFTVKYEPAV